MAGSVEKSAIRKVYLRLLPIALLTYFLCYVDRINVGFAALTMRGDLHMTAAEFGFAAGTFYWGYFIFEVPSNIILEKVGARLWIARIMITWGLLAAATAFATGVESFAIIRFFLGLAEAGFFPGLILYFTYWFPHYHHARIISGFLIGLPIAVAAWAPVSTAILSLDGWLGLRGWQHMYILEGIPTVLIGILVLFVLTDRPEQAKFLTEAEKNWLSGQLAAERRSKDAVKVISLWRSFFDPKVMLLSLNYIGIVTASLGMLIFIPQIIKSLGVTSNMTVGWLTMIPYLCAAVSLVVWGHISDRMKERRWNLFWACVVSTAGLVMAGLTMGTWWALVGMTIAASGFYGSKGPFWAMPPMFLTGPAAAAAIAWINSIGNLGGFFGHWYVGYMKDVTGSYAGGLYGLALLG
ncbi:MAG TPA: MFS transporter, partial [Rhizomicrobium sp.]|nr:MFS transporter [Rhizomicrobium sp.]